MDQEELKLGLRSIGENLSDSELSAMMGLLVRTGSHHPPAMGQDLNTQNTNAVRAAVAVHFELVEPQCSSIARGPSRPFHHSLRYAPQG